MTAGNNQNNLADLIMPSEIVLDGLFAYELMEVLESDDGTTVSFQYTISESSNNSGQGTAPVPETLSVEVSERSDINGDGLPDLIINLNGANAPSGATAYVIFGREDGFDDTLDLTSVSAAEGLSLIGHEIGHISTRHTIEAAGDTNGDGFDDLVVTAIEDGNGNGGNSGELIMLGGSSGGHGAPVTTVGTSAAEILYGSENDDRLWGGGGADIFVAGAGNDVMHVEFIRPTQEGSSGFSGPTSIDGGVGFDVLALEGAGGNLDFTASGFPTVTGIEAMDLTGSGDNKLSLEAQDLLDLSGEGNDLFVMGNAGDSVQLGAGFSETGHQVIDGTAYNVFTAAGSDARLLAETDVTVTIAVA